MKRMVFFAVIVWIMAMPFNAFAHGTDYRLIGTDTVVAAEFFYSDNTPMQYAEILVYSPKNEKAEYQNGRTDRNGRFAFLPETNGEWRIELNDGMGHAVHAAVTVNKINSESKNIGEISGKQQNDVSKKNGRLLGETPTGVKLLFGLSILLNIFMGLYVWKRKP